MMADIAEIDGEQIDDIAKVDNCDVPAGTLAEDVIGNAATTETCNYSGGGYWYDSVSGNSDYDLATKTLVFAAVSRAVAVGHILCRADAVNDFKLRLYMGGVQVAETAYIPASAVNRQIVGTRALSGSQACKIALHNYDGSSRYIFLGGIDGSGYPVAAAIGVGSIKLL
jgi:hypothetical protein